MSLGKDAFDKLNADNASVKPVLDTVPTDFEEATKIMENILQHSYKSINNKRSPTVIEVPDALSDLKSTITRLQQVVELSADLFRSSLALFKYHPDAILVVSKKGTILMCNQKSEILFNRTSFDLQGQQVSNFMALDGVLQPDGTYTDTTMSTATVTLPDGLFTIMSFREV
jgi:transcriptional regulator with PAS, ATPase and Fis domain